MTQAVKDIEKKESAAPHAARKVNTVNVIARTDIVERKDDILLLIDMPGVSREHISINVHKGVLSVTGERETPASCCGCGEHDAYDRKVYEVSYTLTDKVNATGINATVSNGVVTLIIPKAEEEKPRRIEIKAG